MQWISNRTHRVLPRSNYTGIGPRSNQGGPHPRFRHPTPHSRRPNLRSRPRHPPRCPLNHPDRSRSPNSPNHSRKSARRSPSSSGALA